MASSVQTIPSDMQPEMSLYGQLQFRDQDIAGRIGGDEFVVIVTKDVSQFENILRAFEQRVAGWHGAFVESMTVSCGYIFSSERKWDSIFEISRVSDERMYESKKQYYIRNGIDRRK